MFLYYFQNKSDRFGLLTLSLTSIICPYLLYCNSFFHLTSHQENTKTMPFNEINLFFIQILSISRTLNAFIADYYFARTWELLCVFWLFFFAQQKILLSSCSNLFIIIKYTDGKITMKQIANCKIFSGVEQNSQVIKTRQSNKKNTLTHQIVYSCGLYQCTHNNWMKCSRSYFGIFSISDHYNVLMKVRTNKRTVFHLHPNESSIPFKLNRILTALLWHTPWKAFYTFTHTNTCKANENQRRFGWLCPL